MLQDAKTRILKIWGPYSPKVYSIFIEIVSDWFDDNLKDTSIIADSHFISANRYCENVKFLTNYKELDNPSNMDVTSRSSRKSTLMSSQKQLQLSSCLASLAFPVRYHECSPSSPGSQQEGQTTRRTDNKL